MAKKKKKKVYRRFIRVNEQLVSSPRFENKADAEEWLSKKKREKDRKKAGISADISQILFIDFAREWLKQRMKDYPKSTWSSDEQRLRKYVGPEFAGRLMHTISTREIISFLKATKKEHKLSDATVTRIRVLISTIFSDALEAGHVEHNPAIGIRLKGRRRAAPKPQTWESLDQIQGYLKAARRVSVLRPDLYPFAEVFAYLAFFTGMRKQELIAIKWGDFYEKNHTIVVRWKYMQADDCIVRGTKKGENTERAVFHDPALTKALLKWREQTEFKKPEDFILANPDGSNITPGQVRIMHKMIQDEAGFENRITVHQIRHTFGRHYMRAKGNQKALQSLLGHSSSSTTDIYSELNAGYLKNMDHSGVYGDEETDE